MREKVRGVGLVSLERGRDGETHDSSIDEDVDELLLLESCDAQCAVHGVDRDRLAGDDAAAGLAEGLLVMTADPVAVAATSVEPRHYKN
jgi:hypothetical protein